MSSLVETPEYQAFVRFLNLTLEKQNLNQRLREINELLRPLEPALLGYLTAAELPSFTIRNYLMFPVREPWIYPLVGVSRQAVCEALKMSGLGRMVSENYSTQSLTSYIKQLEEHHQLVAGLNPGALDKILPPALAGILAVKAAFRIRVKKKEGTFHAHNEQETSNTEEGDNDDD